MAFWALKLRHPLTIEAHALRSAREPRRFLHISYEYAARGEMPPVQAYLVSRVDKPALHTEKKIPQMGQWGAVHRGQRHARAIIQTQLFPKKIRRLQSGRPVHSELHSHWRSGLRVQDRQPTTCNFDYSGALTEANHLGNVAYRTGMKRVGPCEFESQELPGADRFIRTEYRRGWKLA